VPAFHADLTTQSVLAMSFVEGVEVESLLDAPQGERDRVATLLIHLLMWELFEFRLVQTDPNFANYRFAPDTRQLILLNIFEQAFEPLCLEGLYDFGASDLSRRIHETGLALGLDGEFWHVPPADVLFLHRKLGGLFLLAARLKARVNVQELAPGFMR